MKAKATTTEPIPDRSVRLFDIEVEEYLKKAIDIYPEA